MKAGGGAAFRDNLKAQSKTYAEQLKSKASQFKNKDFARGSMATCALIAAADGTIDAGERAEMSGFITSNEVLRIFDANELTGYFDEYADKLQSDYGAGKTQALQTIGKLKKSPDQARAVIQVGIVVGGADGNFDDVEQAALREACEAVELDPAEFNL
jgi:tellurite resistance protein TerB